MKAVIWSWTSGRRRRIATVDMHRGRVRIQTRLRALRDTLRWAGLVGRMGKVYTVADGEAFVRELPYAFTGSYVRAAIVEE